MQKVSPEEIVEISAEDGFFLNRQFTSDFRIRTCVYEKMRQAQEKLPDNYYFMIYEAYRPLARQVELWKMAQDFLKQKHPGIEGQELHDLTARYVADPFNGVGSGHQACCSIDISLCDKNGKEYEMGTRCQEIHEHTATQAEGISAEAAKNRQILLSALEGAGLINYPSEWWHFSYGDRLWSTLTGQETIYGPIDI